MTKQNQLPDNAVTITIVESFNGESKSRAKPEGYVKDDIFDSLSASIRMLDLGALHSYDYMLPSPGTRSAIFLGDPQRIATALSNMFKVAHDHGHVIISQSLAGQGSKTATRYQTPEIVVTTTDSLYNVIVKDKIPLPVERFKP